MKHTPGPWRQTKNKYGCRRIGPDRPGHQRGISEVCATVGLFDEEQDRANARLIAAAPTMKEALSPFAARYDRIKREEGDTPPIKVLVPFAWLEQARAALAEAEGES